ncbi:MAG: Calx-beta domain-containing protein [Kiritimatiellia bacterium]|nr:Calx-beta domain-containing protein [Kiritimatiellia bacterium]MDD4442801.1 Calx-beta domain-containing protein [Kiritimatiellia bacterium]MDX9794443.1 Calx-beta domain-containing protein [Kiritimatiellia bacterium]
MVTRLSMLGMVLAIAVPVLAGPAVGTDPYAVAPNAWTLQLAAAKKQARLQNRPLLVACVDFVTCGYSKAWDKNVLQTAAWRTFLVQNPMFLVMLDRSKLSSAQWQTLTAGYRSASGSLSFPTVAVHDPAGRVVRQFVARGVNGASPGFFTVVREALGNAGGDDDPVAPGTVGFSVAAQTVSEDDGTVVVTVTRTGGAAGSQRFRYATVAGTARAGADFKAVSGTLRWSDGDSGSKTIPIPLYNDGRWREPVARTFSVTLDRRSGDAAEGVVVQTVTVLEAEDGRPPVFMPPSPASGATRAVLVNTDAEIAMMAQSASPVAYSASGLPSGFSIDATTGMISGKSRREGAYAVSVRAANAAGEASLAFTLSVQKVPGYARGKTFRGVVFQTSDGVAAADLHLDALAGIVELKVSSTGKITAKIETAAGKESWRGTWVSVQDDGAFLAVLSGSGGRTWPVTLEPDGILHGRSGTLGLLARTVTVGQAADFAGAYTVDIPVGVLVFDPRDVQTRPEVYGAVTGKVGTKGKVTYIGRLLDGERFSGSASLLVFSGESLRAAGFDAETARLYGCFPIFKALYRRKGRISALVWLEHD